MSVRRAQAEIDSREFVEWVAFFQLEPFGSEMNFFRTGILASVMANLFSKRKSKPADFVPKFGFQTERKSVADMEASIRRMFPRRKK